MEKIKNQFLILWRNSGVREVTGIFLVSRLAIFLIGFLSSLVIIKGEYFYLKPLYPLSLFYNWDSSWYMSIVLNGYSFITGPSSAAFFPLYPWLVKAFSFYTNNEIVIGIVGFIISNVALFLACLYLYRLILIDYQKSIALRSVFFLLIFPASFFFSIFYTEGLFIFLLIASFYYARKKLWLISAIFGFFLVLTRSVGIFIFIPLLLEYFNLDFNKLSWLQIRQKINKDIVPLFLVPLGAVFYLVSMYLAVGDAWAYFKSNDLGWQTKFSSIITTWSNPLDNGSIFYDLLIKGVLVFALLVLIYLIYKRVRLSYIVYTAVLLFIYNSTYSLKSTHRLVSVIFPIYLAMALLADKYKWADYFLTIFSVMLLTLLTILFVNGYWLI